MVLNRKKNQFLRSFVLIMFTRLMGLGFVVLCSGPVVAAEQMATFRLLGLFQPDRSEDFREIISSKIPDLAVTKIDYDLGIVELKFDPDKLLNKAKPEQYLERLENLIRQASYGTFSLIPLSKTTPEKLEKIEIKIAGLDCKACSFAAYDAVAKLDGVERATVSFKEGQLFAWIDPMKVDRAKLVEALLKKRVDVPKH